MRIDFDVSQFKDDARGLIDVLAALYRNRAWRLGHHKEIEEVVCRTPSVALKFCQMVNGAFGVSREAERVFVKNPSIGIRYLRLVTRSSFLDEKVQARFWRKVTRDPELAYQWCRAFGRRLSEDEEAVFAGSFRHAKDYAAYVIRGPFPDKVHQMLVLRSFENLEEWDKRYLSEYMRFAESCSKKDAQIGT